MMRWLWLSLAVIVLDQITKYLADTQLNLYEPVALLPGLNLMLSYNTGAAFSFLADAGGWQRWLFVVLAVVVAVMIVMWLRRLQPQQHWQACALTLLLGGAIGNLWDRLVIGHVVDFIDLYVGHWHWPAFNVADSAITVGAIMLIMDGFRQRRAAV